MKRSYALKFSLSIKYVAKRKKRFFLLSGMFLLIDAEERKMLADPRHKNAKFTREQESLCSATLRSRLDMSSVVLGV